GRGNRRARRRRRAPARGDPVVRLRRRGESRRAAARARPARGRDRPRRPLPPRLPHAHRRRGGRGRGRRRRRPPDVTGERTPDAAAWDAVRGAIVTRALAIAVDLGVPQALADGPRTVEDLAASTGAKPDLLHRVLRALASDGIFAENERGVFRNTPAST